jgi:hypothetical protein
MEAVYTNRRKGLSGTAPGPSWSIKSDHYCSDWKEGPKRARMKVEKPGDTVSFLDSESGQLRIKVLKTVPGNAENLK